jgi:hypothetical protein
MHERAASIGARFAIESHPGETCVRLHYVTPGPA